MPQNIAQQAAGWSFFNPFAMQMQPALGQFGYQTPMMAMQMPVPQPTGHDFRDESGS